jgi:hypothetical protein
MMKKQNDTDLARAQTSRAARQARLHALLFAGATLATTLLTVAAAEPKYPRFVGE